MYEVTESREQGYALKYTWTLVLYIKTVIKPGPGKVSIIGIGSERQVQCNRWSATLPGHSPAACTAQLTGNQPQLFSESGRAGRLAEGD